MSYRGRDYYVLRKIIERKGQRDHHSKEEREDYVIEIKSYRGFDPSLEKETAFRCLIARLRVLSL